MTIYLCIKFQSNSPILSKDIARKPKVLHMGRTGWDGRDGTGRMYVQTGVILYAPIRPPPPPTENGGGIKKPYLEL